MISIVAAVEIVMVIIQPVLTLIPLSLNLLSVYIFGNIEFKTTTYRYLRINSILDTIVLAALCFANLCECKELCSTWWSSNYWPQVYQLCYSVYISRVFRTISGFVSVEIAWSRYLYMRNVATKSTRYYWFHSFAFIFSFIFYFPNLFLNEIVKVNNTEPFNSTIVHIYTTEIKKDENSKKFFLLLFLLHCLLSVMILTVSIIVNVMLLVNLRSEIDKMMVFQLRNQQQNKRLIQSLITYEERQNKNIEGVDNSIVVKFKSIEIQTTKMVIWLTLVFIFDQFLVCVIPMLFVFLDRHAFSFKFVLICIYFMICLSHLLNFSVYYTHNETFKEHCKKICQKKRI